MFPDADIVERRLRQLERLPSPIEHMGRGLSYSCDRGSPTNTSFCVIHVVFV